MCGKTVTFSQVSINFNKFLEQGKKRTVSYELFYHIIDALRVQFVSQGSTKR